MKKSINIVISIAFYILVAATVLYLVAGFKYYPLKTNADNYAKGSLLVIKSNKELASGNNAYIYLNNEYKVVNIASVGKDTIDIQSGTGFSTIKHNEVIGTILFSIPLLGTIIDYLMTSNGIITLAIIVFAYFLLMKYLKK